MRPPAQPPPTPPVIPIAAWPPPQGLANVVWAYAKLNFQSPALLDAVAQEALREGRLDGYNAQEVANTVWAYAYLNRREPLLMEAVARRCLQPGFLGTFSAQAVANTAWAFARLQVADAALMRGLAARTVTAVHTFKAQEVVACASPPPSPICGALAPAPKL